MPNKAAGSVPGQRAARYDTPWQRLPWTGPLALLAWALALWAMALGLTKAPAMPERPLPPINARFIELPKPTTPELASPVVRPDPPVQQRVRKVAKPTLAAKPAAAQAQAPSAPETAQPSAPPAPDLSQTTGLPMQVAAPGTAQARPNNRSRFAGHPGATVRAGAIGVVQPPLALSIHNEENAFDYDGTGNGASPGGWMQESAEDCEMVPGQEGPCKGPVFSQPARPWCYDANPFYNWDIGSCKMDFERAIAAFKRKDYAAAFAVFSKLGEKEYVPAQSNLGAMYADGTGVPRDDQQAAYWYRKAAAGGDAKASYNLALMYSDGVGVPRDDQQAAHWYRKAAYSGYAHAQYNLGVMYALGTGVPRDDQLSAYWYRKAADRGNAVAQYNLGVLYAEGAGLPRDEKLAAYWYCKGTVRGEAKARSSLAQLYATGTEEPSGEELVYFCWLLSADKRAHQIAYQGRELYEKKLTPAQIANAIAAANTWKRK